MINQELMTLVCESMLFVKKIIEEEEPGEKKNEHINGYIDIMKKLINKISDEELIPMSKQYIVNPSIQVAGNNSYQQQVTDYNYQQPVADYGYQQPIQQVSNYSFVESDPETEVIEIEFDTEDTPRKPRETQMGGYQPTNLNREFVVEDIESDSLMNYLNTDQNKKNDSLLDNIKEEELVVELEKETPKSILKKVVTISEDNQIFDEITGGAPKLSKQDKLKRKLKTTPVENVQRVGKELGFKPPTGKKTMSKTYITEKILGNPKIYDKAYKSLRNYAIIKSDTASES